MNKEDALYINNLYLRGSWGWVCQTCCEQRPDIVEALGYDDPADLEDNQLVGKDLIVLAEKVLGEDWVER